MWLIIHVLKAQQYELIYDSKSCPRSSVSMIAVVRYVPGRVTFYMAARLCEDPGTD